MPLLQLKEKKKAKNNASQKQYAYICLLHLWTELTTSDELENGLNVDHQQQLQNWGTKPFLQ